jgi:urease accessory protein
VTPRFSSRLDLTFACRDGHTYLAEGFSEGALKVLRPFELDAGRVVVQLLNVGPGLLAGDRYELRVRLQPGARVVLVSQSATKLHRMLPGGTAYQRLTAEVAAGAELELLPGLVIPFAESDVTFENNVHLSAGARFSLLETWAMGRIGRGERFALRRLSNRLKVYSEGSLTYADGLELLPESSPWLGVTDGYAYLATGFWRWDQPWPQPSTSQTPGSALVVGLCDAKQGYLRALANDGLELTHMLRSLLACWYEQRGVQPVPFERLML